MKKAIDVVLLHGRWPEKIDGQLIKDIPLCDPNNPGNWMGWVREGLKERGLNVVCPVVHDAWRAPYHEWEEVLDTIAIGPETVLVGLSAGGYALLRYLGETGKFVQKVILVAPGSKYTATEDDPLPTKEEFYRYDVEKSLNHQINDGVTIFVSNDSEEVLLSVELYKQLLDAKVVSLKDRGHFSFLIAEFPELVHEIFQVSK